MLHQPHHHRVGDRNESANTIFEGEAKGTQKPRKLSYTAFDRSIALRLIRRRLLWDRLDAQLRGDRAAEVHQGRLAIGLDEGLGVSQALHVGHRLRDRILVRPTLTQDPIGHGDLGTPIAGKEDS